MRENIKAKQKEQKKTKRIFARGTLKADITQTDIVTLK